MDNENKKINISKCFLNILEKEIESSSLTITENRENMGLFLDFILNFFPDDFIPLIELFSNGTISNLNDITNIERLFSNNIFFLLLQNYCSSDKFKDQILYYFESKINYIIFEKEEISSICFFSNNQENININFITRVVKFLENQEKRDNKNYNKLIILFYIAYLKVVFKKYINIINDFENVLRNDKINAIFVKKKSKFVESLSYYILKLYYDNEGNFRDFINASRNFIKFSNDFTENINIDIENQKYYGFDYLFLPLKKENSKKYNGIIKTILNTLINLV